MDETALHNAPAASFTRRLMAGLYDWLLVLALMMVLSVPLVATDNEAVTPGNALYRLALIAIAAGFFIGFWSTRGQTLGMRAWRLHLTRYDGSPVSTQQAAIRFGAACISFLAAGLGFIWVLFSADNSSWHDRWSGTQIRQLPKQKRS
jgi:uncharacterized RDD family membrane protein YckC